MSTLKRLMGGAGRGMQGMAKNMAGRQAAADDRAFQLLRDEAAHARAISLEELRNKHIEGRAVAADERQGLRDARQHGYGEAAAANAATRAETAAEAAARRQKERDAAEHQRTLDRDAIAHRNRLEEAPPDQITSPDGRVLERGRGEQYYRGAEEVVEPSQHEAGPPGTRPVMTRSKRWEVSPHPTREGEFVLRNPDTGEMKKIPDPGPEWETKPGGGAGVLMTATNRNTGETMVWRLGKTAWEVGPPLPGQAPGVPGGQGGAGAPAGGSGGQGRDYSQFWR